MQPKGSESTKALRVGSPLYIRERGVGKGGKVREGARNRFM